MVPLAGRDIRVGTLATCTTQLALCPALDPNGGLATLWAVIRPFFTVATSGLLLDQVRLSAMAAGFTRRL